MFVRNVLKWAARIGLGLIALLILLIALVAITTPLADARASAAIPTESGSILVPLPDGRLIHFRAMGLEHEGPAVILIPCLTCSSGMWQPIQPALAETMRVYAYDPAGFGWSDAPAERFTQRAAAEDLHDALSGLGEDEVILVAHSGGSLIMHFYADQYPDDPRIVGLMWAEGDDYSAEAMRRYGQPSTLPIGLLDTLVDFGLGRPLFPLLAGPTPPLSADADPLTQTYYNAILDVTLRRSNLHTLFEQVREYPNDLADAASLPLPTSAPVYVLDADYAPSLASITPDEAADLREYEAERAVWLRNLAEATPNGRYIEVADSDHFVMFDQPEAVIEAIIDLYQTVSTN